MFTGQYTSDHGTHAGNKEFDPDVPTLTGELQDSGYQTVGFSNNMWISPELGFDRGFDTLRTNMELVKGGADLGSIARETDGIGEQARAVSRGLLRRDGHRTLINAIYSKFFRDRYDDGARLTNWRIKRWLSKHKDTPDPFFLFVNYLEPHLEYDPPEEFKYRFIPDSLTPSDLDSANQDAWAYLCGQVEIDKQDFEALLALYKAELNYLDYRLGKIYDFLEREELLDETVIVITGNHGENIGDHGLMDHQYCLYDTLTHVPLIILRPGNNATERRSELVELRDLFPTLLDIADRSEESEETVSDQSLLPVIHGNESGRDHVYAEYLKPQPSMSSLRERVGTVPPNPEEYNRLLRSLRTDRWKIIEDDTGESELFDVNTDASEKNSINTDHPEIVTELRETMPTIFKDFRKRRAQHSKTVDEGTRARLRELGYLQ
jgi:arylsulfatase A-like enzyme